MSYLTLLQKEKQLRDKEEKDRELLLYSIKLINDLYAEREGFIKELDIFLQPYKPKSKSSTS